VHRFNTIAGFNTGVCLVMANTALATAHNGTTIHDPDEDGFSATLKCHDPNGEIYSVTFTRDQISIWIYGYFHSCTLLSKNTVINYFPNSRREL
jgi:hypothetical protein